MAPIDPSTARVWLEESAWVQRLARRLVRESAQAEDLAQEALTVALERPPAASVPFRSWLGGVVRNLARVTRRGDARRAAREQATARTEALEGSERLAERLEVQERLVAAVRGLDEPYRTTVALRYLEDLTTQEVATRMGVPVKTVHTRLERALAQLRTRLDREHGSRAAWAGLLVPLSVPPPPARAPLELAGPAVAVPLVAMGSAIKWTSAAVALAALGFLALQTLAPHPARGADAPGAAPEAPRSELVSGPAPTPGAPASAREAAPLDPEPAEPAPVVAAAPAVPSFAGFVRDLDGRGEAGLAVGFERIAFAENTPSASEPPAPVESGADGRFDFPVQTEPGRLVASGRGLATFFAPSVVGTPPEAPIVYVGPARDHAGTVIDPDGNPIADAELHVRLAPELAQRLTPGSLEASLALARVTSDADGHFAFPPIGQAPGTYLAAGAEGYRGTRLVLPEVSSATLVVTLTPSADEPPTYAGRVVHADGRPAPGAYVAAGEASVQSAEDGRFEFTPGEGERPTHLRAVLPGFLPAELELATLAPGDEQELLLVLGGAGLTLAGHVRDGEGRPIAGARVWTLDGERFGDIDTRVGDVTFMLPYNLEGVVDGPADGQADGRRTSSESDGTFELTGLVARRYGLWVQHPETFELAGPFEFQAGQSELVLTLAGSEPAQRVAGRVTSLSGAPIAGATLVVQRKLLSATGVRFEHRDDRDQPRKTDADGRFEFPALCVEGTRLLVAQPGRHSETAFALADFTDLETLELALPAVCHLRLTLDDPERADGLSLEDAHGRALDLVFQLGGVICMSSGVQITNGRTERLTTDESAVTLVLRKGAEVVERIPIRLVPGEVNELSF